MNKYLNYKVEIPPWGRIPLRLGTTALYKGDSLIFLLFSDDNFIYNFFSFSQTYRQDLHKLQLPVLFRPLVLSQMTFDGKENDDSVRVKALSLRDVNF